MTIYLSDRTGASIDSVLDDADAGNIGKTELTAFTGDINTIVINGFSRISSSATNIPVSSSGTLTTSVLLAGNTIQQYTSLLGTTFIRVQSGASWSAWKEIYAKGTSKTNAQIDTVIDDADASNVGKADNFISPALVADSVTGFGFSTDALLPDAAKRCVVVTGQAGLSSGERSFQMAFATDDDSAHFRNEQGGTYKAWKELYHTGNTSSVVFGVSVASAPDEAVILGDASGNGFITIKRETVSTAQTHAKFTNSNGDVGSIDTSGTATSYNTSSDPRLKDFTAAPSDTDIDSKFNDLFGAFRTFNWKNDPAGDLVWGFDAHATIDAGLDVGSEGEGPRELALGDVYNTTPAVFEDQDQQVVYKTGDKKGELKFYADGEPVMETISVEVTAAIDHKVSPAGVDQSKAVPILLAKIEQLERRLVAAGL